jgi:hypothetical protein
LIRAGGGVVDLHLAVGRVGINPPARVFRICVYTYMERRIQYGIILLLILTTGLAIYGFLFHSIPGPAVLVRADYSLSVSDLSAAYNSGEEAPDSLYLYKVLSVTGIVKKLRRIGAGNYIVFLGNRSSPTPLVSCIMDNQYNSRLPFPEPGDSVRIRGICAGHLSDVILVQCFIEK